MGVPGTTNGPSEDNKSTTRKVRKPRVSKQRKTSTKNKPVEHTNIPRNQPPNKEIPDFHFNMVVSDAMAVNSRQLLYAHIYNYLLQNNYYETAKRFLKEAEVPLSNLNNPKATNNNSLNLKDLGPNQLLKSKMIISSPDTFLLEWWQSLLLLNNFVDSTPLEELSSKLDFSSAPTQGKVVPILPLQRSGNPYMNSMPTSNNIQSIQTQNGPIPNMTPNNNNNSNNNNNNSNNIPKESINNPKAQSNPPPPPQQQAHMNTTNQMANAQYAIRQQQQLPRQDQSPMVNGMPINPSMGPQFMQQQMMASQYSNMMNLQQPQQQMINKNAILNDNGQVVYPSVAQDSVASNDSHNNSKDGNKGYNNFETTQNAKGMVNSNQQRQVQAQFASQKRKHSENMRNASPHSQVMNQSGIQAQYQAHLQNSQRQGLDVASVSAASSGSPNIIMSNMQEGNPNMKMDLSDPGMQQQYMTMLKSMLVKNQTQGQQNNSSENAIIDFSMMNFNIPNHNNDESGNNSSTNLNDGTLNKNIGKPDDNNNNAIND